MGLSFCPMKRASLVIFIGSLLAASGALATTYVRVEKDGTKTYSDRPLPGGHPIDLQPAQTYSAPAAPSVDRTRPPEEQSLQEAASFHYQCALSPHADETFQNPETVTLSVALTPSLRAGDSVNFSFDGSQVQSEDSPTSASLVLPDRGSHTATVRVTDRYGKVVCDTNTTFHVLRTTLNSPARPVTPRPRPPTPPPRPTPH